MRRGGLLRVRAVMLAVGPLAGACVAPPGAETFEGEDCDLVVSVASGVLTSAWANPTEPAGERVHGVPCPATPGAWTACPIDRRAAPGYSIPEETPIALGYRGLDSAPELHASIGNLAGSPRDGIVFSEFPSAVLTQEGGANPGYLCATDDDGYGPCPEELELPEVPDQVVALAAEELDGVGGPDLLIATLDGIGANFPEYADRLYPDGTEIGLRLRFYSQVHDPGDGWPRWVERTEEVGLADALAVDCAPANVQLVDLDRDGAPEIIFGGFACPPIALSWQDGELVRRPELVPDRVGTNAGVFTTPREDGSQNLFLVAHDGPQRGVPAIGGSSCWRGEVGSWTEVGCPSFGGAPMGFAAIDPNGDAVFEVATSDTRNDEICLDSTPAGPDVSVACFASSWKLPESTHTLAGPDRHSVSWAVAGWDDRLVYVQGYEHPMEPAPDRVDQVPWTEWPQQIHLYRTPDHGQTWIREHDPVLDADVQERGLIGPLDLNGDECVDLLPLPVGLTDLRALINGACAPGTQEVEVRSGGWGAYGAKVVLVRGDRRQASVVNSGGGAAGFGPPTVAVPPDVQAIEVTWTSGGTSTFVRGSHGRFPEVLTAP